MKAQCWSFLCHVQPTISCKKWKIIFEVKQICSLSLYCTIRYATFWVISKNHDAAPTKFWISHQLTDALDPPKNRHHQFANPGMKNVRPGLIMWSFCICKLIAAIFGSSKTLPRVSWWPIQNLVGTTSWIFGMNQKVVPLLWQPAN